MQEFLMVFMTGKVLSLAAMDKMEELYKLSESPNTEIVFRWIRMGIAARSAEKRFLCLVKKGKYFLL